jgi:dTDP-4-amino-4,6-dideoxygalactose transaminase
LINVTKTYLPPLEEYQKYLEKIWENSWVTNNGPLLRELEEKLRDYLGVKHLFYASNGTVVLQIALKALNIKKEVITTPFSYVATTTSLLWENCTPVFADIESSSYTIDPDKIEKLITENTEAILATHVYGYPCNIEKIDVIAKKHGLKVIYDAAHAFGTVYRDKQLCSYGDIATISFHATKLFHTIEGGAIITNDDELAKQIRLYRSFGHINDDYFSMGINGKNSEFHAAMGLCLLPRVPEFINRRKELVGVYEKLLDGTGVVRPVTPGDTNYNYSYYPVILKSEEELLSVRSALQQQDISPRRYFFPSLNTLPYLKGERCPVSEDIAKRVLCLPLYYELHPDDIRRVCDIVKKNLAECGSR